MSTFVEPPSKTDKELPSMSGEVNILKKDEVAHLKDRIRLAVVTYEEKLTTLFFQKHEISMKDFLKKAQEYFDLSPEEALLLTRYLFERRNKPKVTFDKNTVRRSNFIHRRLKEFVGKYTKIDTDDMTDMRVDFDFIEDEEGKKKLTSKLLNLAKCDYVSPFDIYNLLHRSKLNLDSYVLVTYL